MKPDPFILEGDKFFNPKSGLVEPRGVYSSLPISARYAQRLLQRHEAGDVEKACRIIRALLDMQRSEPAWENGRFPMIIQETWRDLNANLFLMPALIEILTRQAALLPPALWTELHEAVRRAAAFAEHRWDDEVFDLHRDHKAYSNIFALYIQFLFLASDYFKDERLLRAARAQWRRWFNHISYFGIDEFLSPTYNTVIHEALTRVLGLTLEPAIRSEIKLALDYLTGQQFAVTHPRLGLPVCGTSRDYRLFLKPGQGAFGGIGAAAESSPYQPPEAVLTEYAARQYPHRVSGRATAVPFRFRSWQMPDAALGSMTGGQYFKQQISLLAAVGQDAVNRAVAFIPGEGTRCGGYVCQRDHQALCLFSRLPNSYYRTQSIKPDSHFPAPEMRRHGVGLGTGWREEENSADRLVLSAYGRKLVVLPFAVENGRLERITLTPSRKEDGDPVTFVEGYLFPDICLWFGCLVTLHDALETPPAPAINWREDDRIISVSAGEGLVIRLFRQPSGELTELYDDDWRTTPLVESPAFTLWPGEMTGLAAGGQ